MLDGTRKFVVSLSVLLFLSGASLVAQSDAGVSGTVRDRHGKPQMGVMVELLGSATSATALTDLEGHYQIKNVLPGVYQLRATAALYLPRLRRQLWLQARLRPTVNLTMSGFFDETSWMAGSRPESASEEDDWKWTLRSPENRPMLRLADDDPSSTLPGPERVPNRSETHAALTAKSSSGGFGSPERGLGVAVAHRSKDQRKVVTVRSVAARAEDGSAASPVSLSTLLQSDAAMAGMSRMSVRVQTFPQIRSAQGDPLAVVAFGSAERVQMGDFAALEVGSETQLLRAGRSALVTRPFLRLTAQPIAGWTATYAFATSSDLSHFEDLGKAECAIPTAVETGRSLVTAADFHQEVTARRNLGRARVHVVYEHDAVRRTALSGKLLRAQSGSVATDPLIAAPREIVLDRSTGAFRLFAPGTSTSGFGLGVDVPLAEGLTISGGYLSGAGVSLEPVSRNLADPRFSINRSNAFLTSVKGRIAKSGTRVSVTYRWQPGDIVGTISPYQVSEVQPYLGVHLVQSIPAKKGFPAAVAISIDGDNLAGEGSQPLAIAQQEAYLASALRDLRARLSFTF